MEFVLEISIQPSRNSGKTREMKLTEKFEASGTEDAIRKTRDLLCAINLEHDSLEGYDMMAQLEFCQSRRGRPSIFLHDTFAVRRHLAWSLLFINGQVVSGEKIF